MAVSSSGSGEAREQAGLAPGLDGLRTERRIATLCGLGAILLGVAKLVGWGFRINFLIRIAPGYKGIAPVVASFLIFLGLILLRLATGHIGKSERLSGFGTVQDITERKQAEQERERLLEERRRQTALLETILENTDAHLVYLDRDFNFIWVNSTYARACRRPREEFVGRNHFDLYPHAENEAIFRRVRDTGEPVRFVEKPFEHPDSPERGTTYWDWTLTPLKNAQGEVESLVFSLSDVTEKVQTRQQLLEAERLRTQMAEAIALEINYRMKNNLMLVSGILDLQLSAKPEVTDAATALRQAKARIAALSTVHEQMYERRSERVDLSGVLRRIAEMAVAERVELSIQGEPVLVSSRAATTLALVGNELVTNALKHGAIYPNGGRRVDITLSGNRAGWGCAFAASWSRANCADASVSDRRRAALWARS